ncbi:hypothetical protein [Desmospora activa]|uniref:Glycosyl-4,4'-diaponeurosporenoate acyltransferase n=1 Tax=Desmospora activa DSM 45169 TaxID=1121389 RepID=A0A2T4Z7D1_9BACL|nr:hypothetical protein [Desmospora activa]PTM57775.1 hypothetical protein C8J48_0330 [Desmospora activa DSM 45169]
MEDPNRHPKKILDIIFGDQYFRVKRWEQEGKIYESIGINHFKKKLLLIAKKRRNEFPFKNYFLTEYSIDGLKAFERKTRKSERAHLLIAVVMLLYTLRIAMFINGIFDVLFLLFFLLLNIIINIYPFCLQRYNRIRINQLLNKRRCYDI